MLALIEMPSGKLLRLPEHWQEYRIGIVSGEE
jgi:hypothetical protein